MIKLMQKECFLGRVLLCRLRGLRQAEGRGDEKCQTLHHASVLTIELARGVMGDDPDRAFELAVLFGQRNQEDIVKG